MTMMMAIIPPFLCPHRRLVFRRWEGCCCAHSMRWRWVEFHRRTSIVNVSMHKVEECPSYSFVPSARFSEWVTGPILVDSVGPGPRYPHRKLSCDVQPDECYHISFNIHQFLLYSTSTQESALTRLIRSPCSSHLPIPLDKCFQL